MLVLQIKDKFEIFDEEHSLNKVNARTVEIKEFPVIIGRKPDENLPTIFFPDSERVSAKHCFLFNTDKEGICVMDISRNGTSILRNKKIIYPVKNVNFPLIDGDTLIIFNIGIKVSIYDVPNKKVAVVQDIKSVVKKNLELMVRNTEGGMYALIGKESMGGNAGKIGELPCVATNFFFDDDTGEIMYFENPQSVPKDILARCKAGLFRLATDWGKSWKYNIISFSIITKNDFVRTVIEKTVKEYNTRFGFKVLS